MNKVNVREGDSPYAIQNVCFAFARDKLIKLLPPDEISFLEATAYQEGSDVQTLYLIVGLEMRDLILAERETDKTPATG